MRSIRALFSLAVALASASAAFGGEVIYQKAVGGGAQKPVTLTETITLPEGKEPYILNIVNGAADGQHRLSSITVSFNGERIVGPSDLSQSTEAVNKAISPLADNQLTLTLRGAADGYVLVRILGGIASTTTPPAGGRHNQTQANADSSLTGYNVGDSIVLMFDREPAAALYVVSAASSPDGPWQEIDHLEAAGFPEDRTPTIVETGEETTDTGQAREANRDFHNATTHYRLLALDGTGNVVREYAPVSVPPYIEEVSAPLETLETAGSLQGKVEESSVALLAEADCGGPCIYDKPFLSDSTLTDDSTMSLEDIRKFLADHDSFLKGDQNHQIKDVDGNLIDPAQLIYDAAQNNGINPQVILATLQKESSAITSPTRPNDTRLTHLAGFGGGSTVANQLSQTGAQLRRDYNRLTAGQPTLGGWEPNAPHPTKDGKTVCPANKSSAILFTYTPYVGPRWGGNDPRGQGNSLFYRIFYDTFGFGKKPLFCGTYLLTPKAPLNDVLTQRPEFIVQVRTGVGCRSQYTLSVDGRVVANATEESNGLLKFPYAPPLAPLALGRHRARLDAEAIDCDIKATTGDWFFQVKSGKKIAMVIDDTGSMGDDIEAVKGALSGFIASQTSQPNSPDIEWSLITYKDGVSFRGTTTDPATIQGMVAGLFASGGDDCPEEGLGALSTAAALLAGDDDMSKEVVLATDASPHGGSGTVASTLSALQASGVRVNTLLTGDCVSSALTAASAFSCDKTLASASALETTLSAREVFSEISAQTGGLFFYLPGAGVAELTAALNEIFQSAGGGGGGGLRLSLEVSPAVLTPVNHQLVEIAPILGVSGDEDPNPRVTLLSVTTSEAEDGQGSGNTPGDIVVTEDGRIFLRAERSGTGNDRVYTLTYRATDASGKSSTASAEVLVPHDNQ